MAAPTITALPEAPSRLNPGETFASKASAWVAAMDTLTTEMNTATAWVEDQATAIDADATTASTAATEAAASAAAAAASSGATVWVSGASYTATSSTVISPVNQQTYRAKTTHSGETTDPSLDSTNWQAITVDPSFIDDVEQRARNFSLWTGA